MSTKITMLCGGVGGARGALALYENFPHEDLTFIVNTGDDFQHLGLDIWPDWDTVVYHLGQVQEATRGWGRRDEGTRMMEELSLLGAPDWFHLGDRDVALHLFRTHQLREGVGKAHICDAVCKRFGVTARVLPASEDSLQTNLLTQEFGELSFQEYFVKKQCRAKVCEVLHKNASQVRLTEGVFKAIADCQVLLMAPSNPFLSLQPMLEIPSLSEAIQNCTGRKLAVSPLIGGRAVKGPLDSLIETLSPLSGQAAVAHFWKERVEALLLPEAEVADAKDAPMTLKPCHTWLKTPEDRQLFARDLKEVIR